MNKIKSPIPIFDSVDYLDKQDFLYLDENYCLTDIKVAISFLKSYQDAQGTFNSYRREIERLLQWSALVAKKPLSKLKRDDIEGFIKFCQKPPKKWIGLSKPAKFIEKNGKREPNPAWRPFLATLTKAARRKGESLDKNKFELSNGSIKEMFAILSSFYNYMLQDEYVYMNPVALIRQKSKFIRKRQSQIKIRRLSELQWDYVIKTTEKLAEEKPELFERPLFILSALYSMYLRISELTATERWIPKMNDFSRDSDGNWWFTTVGKGNKEREIAVSNSMLKALRRWRKFLGLSAIPAPTDNSPLIPKVKGSGPIKSTNYIRRIVQKSFDLAIEKLTADGFSDEAEVLNEATVHWLRHTGISDDIKIRPREHVRDDAGHSSSATTDRYIDIEKRERHHSAKKKIISE